MNLLGHRFGLPPIESLGWTLIHSMWQLTGVALLTFCLLWLLRFRSANARYLTACAALALMAACPVATFMTLRAQDRIRVTIPNSIIIKPIAMGALKQSRSNYSPIGFESAGGHSGTLTHSPAPAGSMLPATLASVWLIGVVLMSVRLLGGWIRVRHLIQHSAYLADEPLQARAEEVARRLGVRGAVRLLVSSRVQVPAAAGWVRTAVLLPTGILTGWPPEQLESLIAHELAHIRRHDYLVNLVQTAVETLLFYHPAVWWLSRQIRAEREHCCDDMAVRVTGSPLTYARALTALEEFRGVTFAATLAPAANGSPLLPRIRRVLGLPSAPAHSASVGVVGALGAALCIFIGMGAGIWTVQAAAGPPPAQPHTAVVVDRPVVTNTQSLPAKSETVGHSDLDSTGSDDTDGSAAGTIVHSAHAKQSDETECSDDSQTSDDTADKSKQCQSNADEESAQEPSKDRSSEQTDTRMKALNDRIEIASQRLKDEDLDLNERLRLAREVSRLGIELGEQASRIALKETDRALKSAAGDLHLSLHLTDGVLRIAMKETNQTVQRSLRQALSGLNGKDHSDPDDE